jgi:hypothetical protein
VPHPIMAEGRVTSRWPAASSRRVQLVAAAVSRWNR